MRKMIDYQIIRAVSKKDEKKNTWGWCEDDLSKEILELCQQGYEPVGGVCAIYQYDSTIPIAMFQAIAKYEDIKEY